MPRLVGIVVFCLVMLGAVRVVGGADTTERRRRNGDEWARSRLAYVEPRWTSDVDRCLAHRQGQ